MSRVGYDNLMILQWLKITIQSTVAKYGGELVQNYGDKECF